MATRSMLDTLTGTTPPAPPPAMEPKAKDIVLPSKGNVRIVPYNATLDQQADAFLSWMWKRLQKDDLVEYYWPGQKETGFATFVRMMSGDAQVGLVVTDSKSGQWEDTIAGFITWTPSRMGMSEVIIAGFIFFREFWNHHTTDNAGVAAFRYWFTETPTEVILGVCPSTHVVALRYNKRIGLHEVGRIPKAHICKGAQCDAVLVAITKDEWKAREEGK